MIIVSRIKKMFWIAVAFFLLMSASILIMPMASEMGARERYMLILSGCEFWVSFVIGYILIFMANKERKYFIRRKLKGDVSMGCRAGIITFFDNVPATIADIAMISSFLLFFGINFTELRYKYISYVLLFILVFSLNMHCLFNGRIYKITKYKPTRRD